jgi:hypothetical protein
MPARAAPRPPIGRAGALRCNARELAEQPRMSGAILLLARGPLRPVPRSAEQCV